MAEDWMDVIKSKFFTSSLEEIDINGTIKLKQKHIPKQLFKYREVNEFAINNLRDSSLYCTFASTFNDPYDSTMLFDPNFGRCYASQLAQQLISKTELKAADIDFIHKTNDPLKALLTFFYEKFPDPSYSSANDIDKVVEFFRTRKEKMNSEIISNLNSQMQNMYKICSLSERLDSILMWGHYGNQHKGFAMEYDFSSLPIEELMGRCLWPAIYSEHIYNASELLVNVGSPEKTFNNMVAIIAALHKAKDWEYEKEWRIIIPDSQKSPPQNFRAPLKAVYLGSKISDTDASKIYSIATLKKLPIYKMQLSQHEFKMVPVPFTL